MSLWVYLPPKVCQARPPVCLGSTDTSISLLTSYTIKLPRGLDRSVVHHKIIPTSDREVLCHCLSSQIPFQCLTVKRGTKVQSHCHSPFVPTASKTQVGSILLRIITPIACKENIFIERMSVNT